MKTIITIVLVMLLTMPCFAANKNLYEMFKGQDEIKVYLKNVETDVSQISVDTGVYREVFKEVLAKRVNKDFTLVRWAKDADVVVAARIKKYIFKDKVMPRFFSTYSLVADATAPKSSGKAVVDYKVYDPAEKKLLMEFKNFTTEERRPRVDMVGDASFRYTMEKNINRFIYRTFSKQNKKL